MTSPTTTTPATSGRNQWAARYYNVTPAVSYQGRYLSVRDARSALIGGRRIEGAAVLVYETTDRQGTALHVGYVRIPADFYTWAGQPAHDDTTVFEIPTAALTDI
ncbi:hypothetical protein OG607_27420 [Streptomyces sp. NBC_01537]|uniref:hypothetical protein n=1 Tax=Streptomyces sp. NBC_01537 TaxID=2903896 RepID=UPI00386C61B2